MDIFAWSKSWKIEYNVARHKEVVVHVIQLKKYLKYIATSSNLVSVLGSNLLDIGYSPLN